MTQDPNVPATPVAPAASGPSDYVAPAAAYTGPAPTKDEQNMGVLLYILGVVTWIIGPLIIWMMKKQQSKFLDDQGKEVINWGITVAIAGVILSIAGIILVHIPVLGRIIVLLAQLALFVVVLVFAIQGAMTVNKGRAYRFPFAIRLLK